MHQYLLFLLLGSIPLYGYTIFLFVCLPIKYVWITYTFWLLFKKAAVMIHEETFCEYVLISVE